MLLINSRQEILVVNARHLNIIPYQYSVWILAKIHDQFFIIHLVISCMWSLPRCYITFYRFISFALFQTIWKHKILYCILSYGFENLWNLYANSNDHIVYDFTYTLSETHMQKTLSYMYVYVFLFWLRVCVWMYFTHVCIYECL